MTAPILLYALAVAGCAYLLTDALPLGWAVAVALYLVGGLAVVMARRTWATWIVTALIGMGLAVAWWAR